MRRWFTYLAFMLAATVAAASLPDIYPGPERAVRDVAVAIDEAGASHKRVILDFGGNWCPDCHVLDSYFHDGTNLPVLSANFILVHVNIGTHEGSNRDIAERYHVPLDKGVPALAVLDERGQLLYSQQRGEFEAMRHMQSSSVSEFLAHWRR